MVEFPANPVIGQIWVAENAVTYAWLGDRWSSAQPLALGITEFYIDNGRASTTTFNNDLDGGTA